MGTLHYILLGIVEGFTEFLPVSSTAHLVLASRILKLEATEFIKTFEIAIQLGAIFAVVFLYWQKLVSKLELNKKVIAAFIPTALVGLVFYKIVKNIFLENYLISVYALLVGGLVLIIFELLDKEREKPIKDLEQITYNQALIIGCFQSIAIIPGVSRAAATILGGMTLGISRKAIVEFSFLLAIPTITAATGLDLLKSAGKFDGIDFLNLGVGFMVSFATAVISIKFLIKFIQNHNFVLFGIYRILLALGFLFFFNTF